MSTHILSIVKDVKDGASTRMRLMRCPRYKMWRAPGSKSRCRLKYCGCLLALPHCQPWWQTRTLIHCWWEFKVVQPFWKTVEWFLKKLKILKILLVQHVGNLEASTVRKKKIWTNKINNLEAFWRSQHRDTNSLKDNNLITGLWNDSPPPTFYHHINRAPV